MISTTGSMAGGMVRDQRAARKRGQKRALSARPLGGGTSAMPERPGAGAGRMPTSRPPVGTTSTDVELYRK